MFALGLLIRGRLCYPPAPGAISADVLFNRLISKNPSSASGEILAFLVCVVNSTPRLQGCIFGVPNYCLCSSGSKWSRLHHSLKLLAPSDISRGVSFGEYFGFASTWVHSHPCAYSLYAAEVQIPPVHALMNHLVFNSIKTLHNNDNYQKTQ